MKMFFGRKELVVLGLLLSFVTSFNFPVLAQNNSLKDDFRVIFGAYPDKGSIETQFKFQVDIEPSKNYNKNDYLMRVDFDGDLKFDTNYSTQRVFYYSYNEVGYYLPRLLVKSPTSEEKLIIGLNATNQKEIYVQQSNKPEAKIVANTTSGEVDDRFYFDAIDSFDFEEQYRLQYRFDVNNDGIFETEFSDNSEGSFKYTTPGLKEALVEVKDRDGNTDTEKINVIVRERDFPPRVTIVIRSGTNYGNNDKFLAGVEMLFTANAKDTERKGYLLYRWDFDGDGKFDSPFLRVNSVRHTYRESGYNKVIVEVQDAANNTDTAEREIFIAENTAPKAVLRVNVLNGTTATRFTFDARGSTDNQFNNNSLNYRWDFDGDLIYDTQFLRNATENYFYETSGKKKVTVQVRDPLGMTDEASVEVEVLVNSAPKAFFIVSPYEGTFNTLFQFDASSSGDRQDRRLRYRWDFDYQGEDDIKSDTISFNSKISHRFQRIGFHVIKLDVIDEVGAMSSYYQNVQIHWASPYLQFLQRQGVMRGYTGGDMKPEQYITRAEFITLIIRAKKINTYQRNAANPFADINRRDWYYNTILIANQSGYVQGYADNTFRPNNLINRAEATAILMRAFEMKGGHSQNYKSFSDVNYNSWYGDALKKGNIMGIIDGYADNTFRPYQPLKRGEAAKLITNALKAGW